jgi:hypothetical protein
MGWDGDSCVYVFVSVMVAGDDVVLVLALLAVGYQSSLA